MTSICQSSNLQALIDSCNFLDQAQPLLVAYNSVMSEDHRSTQFADEDHHQLTKPPRSEMLDDESYQLLLQMLNKKFKTLRYTSHTRKIWTTWHVQQLEKVSIRGVVYSSESLLLCDSNVLFRQVGGLTLRAGKIQSIFRLQGVPILTITHTSRDPGMASHWLHVSYITWQLTQVQ